MNSCIYRGSVRHRRYGAINRVFSYNMFMMYVDLAELPTLFDGRWFWSAHRPAPAWFRRADYLGDADLPLDVAVRRLVFEQTSRWASGPIRLLTHMRYFGYVQNPVSFYYCFADDGVTLETIVAEVTNTPWGDRHAYVLPAGDKDGKVHATMAKAMHVSPFMPMDHRYEWWLSAPARALTVHMENHDDHARVFDATMILNREPLDGRTLALTLLRFPLMTVQVVAGIYLQALRLWVARAPFHPHPKQRKNDAAIPSR